MHFCLNGKAGIWWRLRKVKNKIYTIMVILLKIPGLFTGKLPPNNAFSVKLGIISSGLALGLPPTKKGGYRQMPFTLHIFTLAFFFFYVFTGSSSCVSDSTLFFTYVILFFRLSKPDYWDVGVVLQLKQITLVPHRLWVSESKYLLLMARMSIITRHSFYLHHEHG